MSDAMREKIAEIVSGILHPHNAVAEAQCDDIADAIIAALPGMVPELVWVMQNHKNPDQIGYHARYYSIYESTKTGACAVSSGAPYFFGPVYTSDIEAAKAAAQKHHTSAILSALGVTDAP